MEVTRIRIYPFDTSSRRGSIRAFAEIELNGKLLIRGIRIIESKTGGLFIGWPGQKTTTGEYRDLVEIIDGETNRQLRHHIIHAFTNLGLESSSSDARENQA